MAKYFTMAVTMLTTVTVLMIMAPGSSKQAYADDSIWLDDGEGDFELPPVPEYGPADTAGAPAGPQAAAPVAAPVAAPDVVPSEPEQSENLEQYADTPSETEEAPAVETAPKKAVATKKAKTPKAKAKKAAAGGKGLFMTTSSDCPMMSDVSREPASEGAMIVVKANRKIWVEQVDETYVRGFNRAGEPGYLQRSCFE